MNIKETVEAIEEQFVSNGGGMSITIAGGKYTGMTTVASIIEKALKSAGFADVVVHDEETTEEQRDIITQTVSEENIARMNEFNKNHFDIRMVKLN